jgi:hypothetical protein
MISIYNFALIIGLILINLGFIYTLDIIYKLKLQLAISEIKLTSLANEIKLIEANALNQINALLQKKEILNVSTISESSSFFTSNMYYNLIIVSSFILLGYLAYSSISYSYIIVSNSGVYKFVSRVDDGIGYLATSLGYKDKNLIQDNPLSPMQFERLDEISPEILQPSSPIEINVITEPILQTGALIYDPSQTPEVMLEVLNSISFF